MRVHALHHAACFDGAAAAAIFTAFYRSCVRPDADMVYIPKHHRPGDPYVESDFTGDDVAILDFRYSCHPKLGWFFDHHVSAFQLPGEREHFENGCKKRKFYDPSAPSCTGFVARIAQQHFGFDPSPFAELLHWAELVDSASFPDPTVPVELREPALRLMTFAEQNHDATLVARFIEDLGTMPLHRLAQADYVSRLLEPVLERHHGDIELIGQRCEVRDGVIELNLLDQPPRSYNKFIPYYHHPSIRYVVGLNVGPDGHIQLTAGYNPWLPREHREHNISILCERFRGGGHPYVGGVKFGREQSQDAVAAQRWIAAVLRGEAQP